MSADRAVADTNVLVYAHFPTSTYHPRSLHLLQRAERDEAKLVLFPQMVAEFVSIVTSEKRVRPSPPKTVTEAVRAIRQVLSKPGVLLLAPSEQAVDHFLASLLQHPVTGPDIFDRQIAAAMLEHGLTDIYTFNVKDFDGLHGISAKEPPDIPPTTCE